MKRMLWGVALAIWSTVAPAAGAAVKIVGAEAPVQGHATLSIPSAPAWDAVLWDVYPQAKVNQFGNDFVVSGTPGVAYRVKVTTIAYDPATKTVKADTGYADLKFVPFGPAPKPDPVDPPNPPDPPTPVGTLPYFVVVIEETGGAAADRARMFTDGPLRQYMDSKGHRWRTADQNVVGPDGVTPPADIARFLAQAKGKPFPQLFLVDSKGNQLKTAPAPYDPAEIIKLLKSVGG